MDQHEIWYYSVSPRKSVTSMSLSSREDQMCIGAQVYSVMGARNSSLLELVPGLIVQEALLPTITSDG